MIGMNTRIATAFTDVTGRSWEWKFIPKDMPFSEWSMHYNMTLRLEPYKKQLKGKFLLRQDMVIIMAEDQEELLKLTAAVTFAIQTRPWRLEVDYWNSFINVDVEFMNALKGDWYD